MSAPVHDATAKRRPAAGGVEWNAVCRCGWRLNDLGSRAYAQARADQHNKEQQ